MRRSESHRLTAIAPASAPVSAPTALARRMLVAVALAGSAALLASCAAPGTSATTAPPQPSSTAIADHAPTPLSDDQLQAEGLFDEVSGEGYAVRWLEPGESIAVVIGGSGGGGECIPQPHSAELDEATQQVAVHFEPPDAAVICTADFRLHGWELALPSAVDAEQAVTVQLVNLRGEDETTEVEIGPDSLLDSGPSADPQPSLIPGEAPEGAGQPTPIPDAQLPSLTDPDLSMTQGDPMVAVLWVEPGTRLAVILGGSGSTHCTPTPIAASTTGIGSVEVRFELLPDERDCSADLRLYGWEFTLPEPVSGTLPVEVTVTGASGTGETATVTVQPDDLLETS